MQLPRLMLAAPMSGSGKTTIAAGLIARFVAQGLRVAPFKVGPDYIDPTYHTLAAGRACHNLDAWMLPPDQIAGVLARRAQGADLALIEGVMGLFDGYSGDDDTGSSAHIARLTATPVLLILDARAMARTAAALVQGLRDFDPRLRVAGVLLNRVGSARHARMITDAIEGTLGLPVVGYLGRDEELHLPERHLGLIPTAEPGRWRAWVERVGATIAATVDLEQIRALAQTALPLAAPPLPNVIRPPEHTTVIAVARDTAFSFLYEDNLDLLRAAGAELVFFSPLRDQALPPGTQALYLCGGFPELYAADLAANAAMRTGIRAAVEAGLPVYAECGGLMYLTEAIRDAEGHSFPMVGVLPGASHMTGRLTLGYRTVRALHDTWLWRAGETLRGHEFHYSICPDLPAGLLPVYELLPDAMRVEARSEGAQVGNVIASYVHLHFLAYPDLAQRFVQAAHAARPIGV
ncbi:MAG: cobyrinate a,c-diamide synthase [Chloroflexaceae bacterium]